MEHAVCRLNGISRKSWRRLLLRSLCGLACTLLLAWGQQNSYSPEVPPNFKLDMETAARLHPKLAAQSEPAVGRYAIGALVFDQLVKHTVTPAHVRLAWQLRIVDDDQLNAYASPDGAVYVESGLASLAGPSAGLWAAILSHEIAHIVRRDWARRYLYQKSFESNRGADIVLGDPGLLSWSWSDTEKASGDFAHFCRQMEIDADREGLMLMARSGYHPDFVPALHHLLHAHGSEVSAKSLYAMHPCWEERDRELSDAYVIASIEFDHRWPAWFASPGGNPPIVVFADEPSVRKTASKGWEIQVPMHCQNLAGAVEVVLHLRSAQEQIEAVRGVPDADTDSGDLRQLTGCTSPRTTVKFNLSEESERSKPSVRWADVYVLDAWGAILARADLTRLPR